MRPARPLDTGDGAVINNLDYSSFLLLSLGLIELLVEGLLGSITVIVLNALCYAEDGYCFMFSQNWA